MRLIFFSLFFLSYYISFTQNPYRNWHVQPQTKKEKLALVIANNYYVRNGNLEAPIPTARKLEQVLIQQETDVIVGHDLTRTAFLSIISEFANKLKAYKSGLIVYMGHGFQINGENYLIPIDANPSSKLDVEMHAINIEYILKKINNPAIPKVIILDACRDNPFSESWVSVERSSLKKGFGDIPAPTNAEIFFTTQKNSKVRDDNPYLQYLMEDLKKGGCLQNMIAHVSKRVFMNNPDQIPARYGQLFADICFGDVSPPPMPKPKEPVLSVTASSYLKASSYNTYDSKNIIDGDPSTPWVEGRNGYGIKEWVKINLSEKKWIKGLKIMNGYNYINSDRVGNRFLKNSRLKTAILEFDNGEVQMIQLKDTNQFQTIRIEPVESKTIKIIISDIYKGTKWADTCISEIELIY